MSATTAGKLVWEVHPDPVIAPFNDNQRSYPLICATAPR